MTVDKKYMSDIVPDKLKDRADMLAENHVNWLLDVLRPLMIEEFRHGFRHGFESAKTESTDWVYSNDKRVLNAVD